MEPFDLLVTLGHIDLFIDLGESYAADKTEKEDNIENTCNTIKEKSENKEEMNIEHEIKGDKINKEVTKTLKLNVKKDKTNKTMNKKKNETPRPELKSLVKRKIKPETAKLLEVNKFRKLTEFWLPRQRENFTFYKTCIRTRQAGIQGKNHSPSLARC